MSAYCLIRQNLYMDFCHASADHYRNGNSINLDRLNAARDRLLDHHAMCHQCREHAREMTELARNAKMPEWTE